MSITTFRGDTMRIKALINLLKLSTFSGTIESIGTTTYPINETGKQTACLDIVIRLTANPSKVLRYRMGIVELCKVLPDGEIACGDLFTTRKYPFQDYYSVKQHTHTHPMDELEKAAVKYVVDMGIEELHYKSKLLATKSDDLNVREVELALLKAIALKCKLG